MAKIEVKEGDKYGKLTIIKEVESRKFPSGYNVLRQFLCRCECGNEVIAGLQMLRAGKRKSCGCLAGHNHTTHQQSNTRIYKIWSAMKERCSNPNNDHFHNYGGRGIKVCTEWLKFEPFYEWAMSNGYRDELTIDRIDVNGDYTPENCRWITQKEQSLNKRNNRLITYKGVTKTLSQWSEETGLSMQVIYDRLKRFGETDDLFSPLYTTEKQRSHKTYTRQSEIKQLFADGKTSLEISKIVGIKHEHIKKALKRWKLM